MHTNELISIIVPFYNVELYLERCLDSIVNQTYRNLEIILIDDGSTDNSPAIADAYAEKDDRIIVIHQKNTGTTVARKNGLKIATGHFLTFSDADDWLALHHLQSAHDLMIQHNVELVSVGFTRELPDEIIEELPKQEGIYTNDGIGENNLLHHGFLFDQYNDNHVNSYLWNKLFIRDIFTKYYMDVPDDIYYIEDAASVYAYLPHCKSCYIANYCGYHYNMCNETAASANVGKSEIYIHNIFKLYIYLKQLYQDKSIDDAYRKDLMSQLQISTMRMFFFFLPRELYDQMILFPFPFAEIKEAKKVIVYGAGHVAESYHKVLKKGEHDLELVAVLDKNKVGEPFMDMTVSALDCLKTEVYDVIVISIDNENIIDDIKDFLHANYDVPKEKIVWKQPMYLLEALFPY